MEPKVNKIAKLLYQDNALLNDLLKHAPPEPVLAWHIRWRERLGNWLIILGRRLGGYID